VVVIVREIEGERTDGVVQKEHSERRLTAEIRDLREVLDQACLTHFSYPLSSVLCLSLSLSVPSLTQQGAGAPAAPQPRPVRPVRPLECAGGRHRGRTPGARPPAGAGAPSVSVSLTYLFIPHPGRYPFGWT
jgi:hypothetical protein